MNKKGLKETLVDKSWTNKSFDSLVKWYYDTKKELDQLIEESNKYKAIMDGDNQESNENQLTLGEQIFIYNLIKNKTRSVEQITCRFRRFTDTQTGNKTRYSTTIGTR